MSVAAVNNPPSAAESKRASKKRAKAEAAVPQLDSDNADVTPDAAAANTNGDSYFESSYIKELQKNMRNVNKKLNAMSKVDSILADNPDTSLDDLLASRKINADQKAQAQKKPALQSSLAQLEEQIAQYKKIDADYQARMASQHTQLTSSHQSEIEQLKTSLKQEQDANSKSTLRQKLLTFSQFLRAAAAKRVVEEEADSDESRAFEGALLLVYGGDDKAVDAALSLIEGSDEQVPSVEGQLLPVKYSHIKQAAVGYGAFPGDDSIADGTDGPIDVADASAAQPEDAAPSSDPTIAHAGLTELGLNQPSDLPVVHADDEAHPIAEAAIGDDFANKAGSTSWDTAATAGSEEQMDESFVSKPRDASETENIHEPAQPQFTNSWADDTGAPANANAQPAQSAGQNGTAINGMASAGDDGFHEVERRGGRGGQRGDGRGRGGRGRGGPRGGGPRGGFRGRGEGRGGRGRGGAPQPQA